MREARQPPAELPCSCQRPCSSHCTIASRECGCLTDDAASNRVQHDLSSAVYVELLHDSRPMSFDGTRADEQQRRDVLVRLALRDQLEDLAFAIGQRFVAIDDPGFAGTLL